MYVGRRVTLYCDPEVRFGKDKVGGTRIAALSHIDKKLSVPLLVSRGRSATFTVEPLPTRPMPRQRRRGPMTAAQVAASTDPAELREWWKSSDVGLRTLIEARARSREPSP